MAQFQTHDTFANEHRGMLAIEVDSRERLVFLRKVYSLLGAALVLFAGSAWFFATNEAALEGIVAPIARMGWIGIIVLMAGLFLVLRMTAARFPINLIGLGTFAVLEGLLTAPILYMVGMGPEGSTIIAQAGVITGVTFGGLTLYTLTTKRDFSWMGAGLYVGFFLLIGIALLSMIFGFNISQIGLSAGFCLLMAGFTIYDTSNIMRRYPTDMAAAAAATLLLDIAILFKHVLILLSSRD